MRAFIFCFLVLCCLVNSISAQSDSLITELEKTLQIQIDTLGDEHLDVAMLYDSLGMMYMKTGKYPKADSLFAKALGIKVEKLEERHPDIADSYYNLGNIKLYRGNYEKADSFFSKALDIRLEVFGEKHPRVADSYNGLGDTYRRTGDYDQAISLLNKALDIRFEMFSEKHPDVAKSYYSLGAVYWRTGDYDQADSLLTKALDIRFEMFGEKHPDVAKSYNILGLVYWRTGDYDQAINFLNKGLNIQLEVFGEKHPNVAMSYINLGVVHVKTGDYDQAISFLNKVLSIQLEVFGEKHPDVALYYYNLGALYGNTGDYEKASDFLHKALDIRLELFGEKHPSVASSYNNLGALYEYKGDYETAIVFFNKTLNIRLELLGKKHPDVASPYNNLGVVYEKTGDYEKAIKFHNKALTIWLEILGERHLDVARSYTNIGNVYKKTGDYEKAISFFDKTLDIRLEMFNKKHSLITETYYNLVTTYEEIDKYKTADSLWHIVIPQSIENLKSTYLFLPDEQRIKYSNTLNSMNTDFYSFAATKGTESTKQLATNHLLNTKSLALDYTISTNQLIKESNDTILITKQEQLNKLNKKIANAEKLNPEEREEKGLNLPEIQEEYDNLAFQILQHPQLKSKLNTETIEWQDIQNHLAPDEATVDFLRVYEKKDSLWAYYGIVIHKDLSSPQFIRIADEKTLTALIETDGQTQPNYLTKRYSRKALYKALWQPLVPHLEGMKTVHISPTNILYRVPFESLQNRKNKYLTTQYEFHYYSAIRDMLREKSRKMTYKNMVMLGHILYDTDGKEKYIKEQELYDTLFTRNTRDGIRPLKETLEEVTKINKVGKKAKLKTTLLTIDAASEDTVQYFVSERAPNIIHFATHGVFLSPLEKQHNKIDLAGTRDRLRAADNPLQRSALMLYGANETWTKGRPILGSGEDGILTALEVTALDLQNTNLVVLSACSTGLGDMHNTEGVFGLQRAFKLAGVEYVVASLWDVDDEATKELMVKFYENLLKKKQDPATALRNAKDYFRNKGWEPVDWAGFILIE